MTFSLQSHGNQGILSYLRKKINHKIFMGRGDIFWGFFGHFFAHAINNPFNWTLLCGILG